MESSELIYHLTEQRKFIHSVLESIKIYNSEIKSRSLAIAYTHLEFARMWMGKLQGALGNPYPYPESYNPESKVIEAPTDVDPVPVPNFNEPISDVKQLRKILSDILRSIKKEYAPRFTSSLTDSGYLACFNCISHLMEANFALGMRLNEIHIESQKPKEDNLAAKLGL
jgi:hypothetical protein